ncbi:CapA family protein [Paenibacillus xylaniclasticus]|uniref:CapA family protein n=1 Tax=Paenibacillus xylaniclasticus TaxID=588083 RepID=UPI000FD89FD9|nr:MULTISPECIES: CapA family protein [Paenibacillus]GFN32165.1 hypothetical protein PCURB6_24250 [Paenibacillus curdlanolyticus]
MASITIAAVGDLLMKGRIIESARRAGSKSYDFDPLFAAVKPYLRSPDLTIGNLETTFSGPPGPSGKYELRKAHTGWPSFNCPDSFAGTLKRLGFDLLTTANNHCVDRGAAGLKRTLQILDQYGLRHTGTSRTLAESRRYTVIPVKGIRVGILSYTTGTNRNPVAQPYLVNKIRLPRIAADVRALKKRADIIIACLHFGVEYKRTPSAKQRRIVQALFRYGVNAVIGAHPHVLQPITFGKVKDASGIVKHRVAAYSLGNFISTKLYNNEHTVRGLILRMKVTKDSSGKTDITSISRIHTRVKRSRVNGRAVYRVVPS